LWDTYAKRTFAIEELKEIKKEGLEFLKHRAVLLFNG
jgi:hypothetical protein